VPKVAICRFGIDINFVGGTPYSVEVHVGERLPVSVADGEAGFLLLDDPRIEFLAVPDDGGRLILSTKSNKACGLP
jgi:hypothetical protein